MKKLLSIITSLGLVTSAVVPVIACTNDKNKDEKSIVLNEKQKSLAGVYILNQIRNTEEEPFSKIFNDKVLSKFNLNTGTMDSPKEKKFIFKNSENYVFKNLYNYLMNLAEKTGFDNSLDKNTKEEMKIASDSTDSLLTSLKIKTKKVKASKALQNMISSIASGETIPLFDNLAEEVDVFDLSSYTFEITIYGDIKLSELQISPGSDSEIVSLLVRSDYHVHLRMMDENSVEIAGLNSIENSTVTNLSMTKDNDNEIYKLDQNIFNLTLKESERALLEAENKDQLITYIQQLFTKYNLNLSDIRLEKINDNLYSLDAKNEIPILKKNLDVRFLLNIT